jgi:signal recognition particle receptor subunit beta
MIDLQAHVYPFFFDPSLQWMNHVRCLTEWMIAIPLLVFANKQDLPTAQAVENVTKSLGLSRGVKRP